MERVQHETSNGSSDPSEIVQPAWGFYETIGWGMIAFIAWSIAEPILLSIFNAWEEATRHGAAGLRGAPNDAISVSISTIAAGAAWIGVTAIAVRWRGWRFNDYVGLVLPSRRELILSLAAFAVLLLATDLASYALGRPVIPQFMIDVYVSAGTPAALMIVFISVVIVAPLWEEIAFRGFLFRGTSLTRFGVPGAILLTSSVWALMHGQYDGFVIVQIFLSGMFLGWLRSTTGSALLTIILHAIGNFAALVQTALKVQGSSTPTPM